MKQRLELHVMMGWIDLAKYHISWDATLSEMLDYQGDGVWYSNHEYWKGYDDKAILGLKGLIKERMEEYHVKDFYVEIEDYEG